MRRVLCVLAATVFLSGCRSVTDRRAPPPFQGESTAPVTTAERDYLAYRSRIEAGQTGEPILIREETPEAAEERRRVARERAAEVERARRAYEATLPSAEERAAREQDDAKARRRTNEELDAARIAQNEQAQREDGRIRAALAARAEQNRRLLAEAEKNGLWRLALEKNDRASAELLVEAGHPVRMSDIAAALEKNSKSVANYLGEIYKARGEPPPDPR